VVQPGRGRIGLASFLSDVGHEVLTALLPSFLTSTLKAAASALGLIAASPMRWPGRPGSAAAIAGRARHGGDGLERQTVATSPA
jgi:hypothetical protein